MGTYKHTLGVLCLCVGVLHTNGVAVRVSSCKLHFPVSKLDLETLPGQDVEYLPHNPRLTWGT